MHIVNFLALIRW